MFTAKNQQRMGGERAVDWQKAHRRLYRRGYPMSSPLTPRKFNIPISYSSLVVFFFSSNFDFSHFPDVHSASYNIYIIMFHDCAH